MAVVIQESEAEESAHVFRFNLPAGLSLRSVRVIDDIPELTFTASPKVPTLQEEDFAAAFRLAAEKERPEFFYTNFPPNHPLHSSRWLNRYSPMWLRGTSLGKLLADVDWNMKCLHIGARSNEDKTTFKSWPKSSNLKGLATHLDFPEKENMLSGSIMMYCDHAKVQKKEDEIIFPEEPTMKIIDQLSESYSAYITEHLPSVAYHDEPNFLKMQEVIKLILAVEWLYNEKKVRVNQNWIQFHTENISKERHVTLIESFPERAEPPPEMVPTPPPDFEPPSTDATICTANSEMYNALVKDGGVNLRYGYIDFGGCQVRIFTDDGEKYLFLNCIKSSSIVHTPVGSRESYAYVALDNNFFMHCKNVMHSLKYPVILKDNDGENFSTSEAQTLLLPKTSSMLQVPIAPDIDVAISNETSDNTELSQATIIDTTNKDSDTADKIKQSRTESLISKDSIVPNSQDKKDASIIRASNALPSEDSQNTGIISYTPDSVDILAALNKTAEQKNFFSPLETLLQNLEDTSADDTPENMELIIETIKSCFEPVFESMIEHSIPYPATVCVSFDEISLEDELKFSYHFSISRHAPFTLPHFESIGTVKLASEDLDFIFAHCDPNAPILARTTTGSFKILIPGVSSWEELLSDMTTPAPRFWQDPYTGMGIPSDIGGVSTSQIPVLPVLTWCATSLTAPYALLKRNNPTIEPLTDCLPKFEPPPDLKLPSEIENIQLDDSESVVEPARSRNNKKNKRKHRVKKPQIYATDVDALVVRSTQIKGTIQPVSEDQKTAITNKFKKSWKEHTPEIIVIFKIKDINLKRLWKNYGIMLPQKLETCEGYYHGASLLCDITADKKLCNLESCGMCGTLRAGFNEESCKRHRSFPKFEEKYILDLHSSSADKHTEENEDGHKAVLLCDVLSGRKYNRQTQDEVTDIPEGFDSMSAITEDDFHSPIIILPNYEAILPRFVIIYKHSNFT